MTLRKVTTFYFLWIVAQLLFWFGLPAKEANAQPKLSSPTGLNLSLRLAKREFLQGEPVFMTLTLQNQGNKDQWLPSSGIGSNMEIVVLAEDGKRYGAYTGIFFLADPDQSPGQSEMRLKPNSSLFFQDDVLRSASEMTASTGEMRIHVIFTTQRYAEDRSPIMFVGTVSSNMVTFRVVKPTGLEAEVSNRIVASYNPKSKEPESKEESAFPFLGRFASMHTKTALEIADKYPNSLYATYLRYYLGEYYGIIASMSNGRFFGEKSVVEFLQLIPNDRNTGLVTLARLGVASGYFYKKEYAKAKSEAQSLIRQFPKTYAAQEASKLLADMEKSVESTYPRDR